MAEAATAEPRTVIQLTLAIKGELAALHVRGRDLYVRIGELLVALKPQIAKGKWMAHIRDNFDFSPQSATEYVKMYHLARTQQRERVTRNDVRGASARSNPSHKSNDFQAYQETMRKVGAQARHQKAPAADGKPSPQARRDRVRELLMQMPPMAYRALATRLHPDAGGSDWDMACLTDARDILVKLIRTSYAATLIQKAGVVS